MTAYLGRQQQFGGVIIHVPLHPQEFIETFHTADDTRLGTRLDAHVLQRTDKTLQVIGRGMLNPHTSIREIANEFIHIVAIGLRGVGTHAFLQSQVAQEALLHIIDVGNVAHVFSC